MKFLVDIKALMSVYFFNFYHKPFLVSWTL